MAASIHSVRASLAAALVLASTTFVSATGQSVPAAVPVPFMSAVAGNGLASTPSAACTTGFVNTDGAAYGDGCPATQASFSSPQGAAIDKYGNVYIGDYSHRLVRVVYNGGPYLLAAIAAANSNFTPSGHALPSFTPMVGNVYTLAGTGTVTTALTVNASNIYPCANNAASATAGSDSLGDGCPGAGAVVGPRDVAVDSDGNLFITDYTDSRIRVFCVNCASGTQAAALITLENAGVRPVNGDIYTIAGYSTGYRDGPGYANATSATSTVALLRSPSQALVSSSDDVFIADNLDNAVRLLYNGGAVANAILTAEGFTGTTAPVVGNVYTIVGDNCTQAPSTSNGSSTTYECAGVKPGTGFTPETVSLGTTTATGIIWSVYLDGNGNLFYTDAVNLRIKVLYGGIAPPLTLPNATYPTLKVGYVYSFAGQGTGTAGAADGVPPSAIAISAGATTATAGAQSVSGDATGNIFFQDYVLGLFYETYAQNGLTAIIGGGNAIATPAAGAYCNGGTSGPQMTDAFYNGCPLTQTKIASPRGPVVSDNNGSLYFGDSVGYFIRKFSYNMTFPTTAVGATTASQSYAFTFLSAQTLGAPSLTDPTDFLDGGSDTCTSGLAAVAGAPGTTCVVNVKFEPGLPGARDGAVILKSATATLGASLIGGTGTGSGLVVDPGTSVTTGSGYVPNGIAVDSPGRVYFTDAASKSVILYSGGTATSVAIGFTIPYGVAVDGADDIFVADSTANTITEIPITGSKFILSSAVSAPHGLATSANGNLYVADTGNNRILIFGPGSGNGANTTAGASPTAFTVAGFTGLSAPQGVAVDLNGNIYAADSAHVVKLTPAGVQSTVSTTGGTAIAVDAAGNLLLTSGLNLVEIPASGSGAVTLYNSLISPKGVALDGVGNAYIADNGYAGYLEFQRTLGYYKFITNPATLNVELTSIGTTAVSSTAYTQTDTTDYSLAPATTNGCSGALAAGSLCNLTATFNPKSAGVVTDNVTFTAPESNGSPTLTLTTVSLVPAISVQAAPATLNYGSTETLTATVYGPSNTSGTVIFYSGTTQLASVPVTASATATYSYTPMVGSYSITATFTPTGSTSPTVTSTPVTFTVKQATPTVGLTLSATSIYANTSVTLTATVSATGGTPTGSVSFYANSTTALGTAALSGSTATLATTALPVGTDCVTAVYSGDNDYVTVTSSCANIVVSPAFAVSSSSTALAFQPNYQEAQANLTITTGGRTDTLSFACQGLPAKLSCAFSPATVTLLGGTATSNVQMLVSNSNATGSLQAIPLFSARTVTLAVLPLGALLLLGLRRRRVFGWMAVTLVSLGMLAGLSGCGTGPTALQQGPGTYNFTVAVNSGATTLQTLNFTLTIPNP